MWNESIICDEELSLPLAYLLAKPLILIPDYAAYVLARGALCILRRPETIWYYVRWLYAISYEELQIVATRYTVLSGCSRHLI